MKQLTKLKIQEFGLMFGADACEFALLRDYMYLDERIDTGSDTADTVLNAVRFGIFTAAFFGMAIPTNVAIHEHLFEDKMIEAAYKDAEDDEN